MHELNRDIDLDAHFDFDTLFSLKGWYYAKKKALSTFASIIPSL